MGTKKSRILARLGEASGGDSSIGGGLVGFSRASPSRCGPRR